MSHIPKVTQRTVKNGFFTILETYYDDILYMIDTSFIRKDSMANLFDDFGKELPVTMKKIKIYRKEKKKIQRLESDTLQSIWMLYYGFSIFFPLLGVYAGIIPREFFLSIMMLPISAIVLFIIITNDKWEKILTHKTVEVKVEIESNTI